MIEAANQSGRSLVQELEYRLENSFGRDVVFDMLLGGQLNGRLLEKVAFAVRDAGRDWASDGDAVKRLAKTVEKLVYDEATARTEEVEASKGPGTTD
ncbi:MAG: hypothetical protein KIT48_07930 [Pseudolabrys sp.]|nr:hypothetical protein [Pseudolabrys sp.]